MLWIERSQLRFRKSPWTLFTLLKRWTTSWLVIDKLPRVFLSNSAIWIRRQTVGPVSFVMTRFTNYMCEDRPRPTSSCGAACSLVAQRSMKSEYFCDCFVNQRSGQFWKHHRKFCQFVFTVNSFLIFFSKLIIQNRWSPHILEIN